MHYLVTWLQSITTYCHMLCKYAVTVMMYACRSEWFSPTLVLILASYMHVIFRLMKTEYQFITIPFPAAPPSLSRFDCRSYPHQASLIYRLSLIRKGSMAIVGSNIYPFDHSARLMFWRLPWVVSVLCQIHRELSKWGPFCAFTPTKAILEFYSVCPKLDPKCVWLPNACTYSTTLAKFWLHIISFTSRPQVERKYFRISMDDNKCQNCKVELLQKSTCMIWT